MGLFINQNFLKKLWTNFSNICKHPQFEYICTAPLSHPRKASELASMCCSQIKNYVIFQSSEVMKQSNAPCVSCQDTRINLRYLPCLLSKIIFFIIMNTNHRSLAPSSLNCFIIMIAKREGGGVCKLELWSNSLHLYFKRCGRTAAYKLTYN